jgi:hypothetical protein
MTELGRMLAVKRALEAKSLPEPTEQELAHIERKWRKIGRKKRKPNTRRGDVFFRCVRNRITGQ